MDSKQKRKYFYLGLLTVHLYGYILSILPFFINTGENFLSIKEDGLLFFGALVWPWETVNDYLISGDGYLQWLVIAVVPVSLAVYLFNKRKFIALGIITYVSICLLVLLYFLTLLLTVQWAPGW